MNEIQDGDWVTGRIAVVVGPSELVSGVLLSKGHPHEGVDERTLLVTTSMGAHAQFVVASSLVHGECEAPSDSIMASTMRRVRSTVQEKTAEVTPRASVLREAESLITGDRNKAYGSPTQNFTNTAEIWTALIRHKLKDGEVLTPAEVASFMIGLKLARTVGEPKRDNWVDMAGYAGCGYEASEGES